MGRKWIEDTKMDKAAFIFLAIKGRLQDKGAGGWINIVHDILQSSVINHACINVQSSANDR